MQKNTLVLFLLLFIQVAAHAMMPARWIPGSNWIESPASLDATSFESDESSHLPLDSVSCPAETPQDKHPLLFMRNSKSCTARFPENFFAPNYCFGLMDNPDQELSYSPDDTPVIPAPKQVEARPTQQPIFMPEPQKTQVPQPRTREDLYPAYLLGKKHRQKQIPLEPLHNGPLKSIGNITEEMQPAEKNGSHYESNLVGQTNHRRTASIGAIVTALLTTNLNKNKKLASNGQLNREQTEAPPAIETQQTSLRSACDENSDNETVPETTKRSPSTDSLMFDLELEKN